MLREALEQMQQEEDNEAVRNVGYRPKDVTIMKQ